MPLLKLKLRGIPIRNETEFLDELYDEVVKAQVEFGEVSFLCHRKYRIRLETDLEVASNLGKWLTSSSVVNERYLFGLPVIFTDSRFSLYFLALQAGVDLHEPVIATGELPRSVLDACERYPEAKRIYFEEKEFGRIITQQYVP